MRVALQEGRHAVLRERLTYEQGRTVRAALLAAEADRTAMADLDLALVRAYVASWDVVDLDGATVDLAEPQRAPDDVIQDIALAAMDLWKGRRDVPKATGARSRNTRPARR